MPWPGGPVDFFRRIERKVGRALDGATPTVYGIECTGVDLREPEPGRQPVVTLHTRFRSPDSAVCCSPLDDAPFDLDSAPADVRRRMDYVVRLLRFANSCDAAAIFFAEAALVVLERLAAENPQAFGGITVSTIKVKYTPPVWPVIWNQGETEPMSLYVDAGGGGSSLHRVAHLILRFDVPPSTASAASTGAGGPIYVDTTAAQMNYGDAVKVFVGQLPPEYEEPAVKIENLTLEDLVQLEFEAFSDAMNVSEHHARGLTEYWGRLADAIDAAAAAGRSVEAVEAVEA